MTLLFATMMLANDKLTATLPPIPREFRAAWVATVDNIDWPSRRDLTTQQQQDELLKIIQKAQDLNLNALVFQVRPSADALYRSSLEPWSEYLTGLQGRAPDPAWDPIEFAVTECHRRGIELHCWFNPYRAEHPAQKGPLAANHLFNTNPGIVKKYDRYLWMDPGEKDVQKRSLDVIFDVVKRYDIDGVHLDDYFYPYPVKDGSGNEVDFPDGPSWNKYKSSGGTLSRDDWRRQNVDEFIENLYKGVKKLKKHVLVGISPFGIARPGKPSTVKAGFDQYSELYADAQKWLNEGWCDYYSPQLYWAISSPQPYPDLLKYWLGQNKHDRHVWAGLYTGRTDPSEGNWKATEILNQIAISRKLEDDSGNVHFSFKCLANNFANVATALKNGPYQDDAFVPASPWLGDKKPRMPRIVVAGSVSFEAPKSGEFMAICYGTRKDPDGGDEAENVTWGNWQRYHSGDPISWVNVAHGPIAAVTFSDTGVASEPVIQPTKR
ncbi:MAG: family 10 glycosylhydrolase [Armatimonadetes bacterium]|nr:family 10 glycosylhydrolase [Armatimonadota bacterium]MBS1725449.1 family 10 glycosylhydrolase [Armatimonadota bacterium]